MPIEFKAPQPTHRAMRLPSSTVLDLAIGSGVNDIPLIRSYLVHADSVADARNSVAALNATSRRCSSVVPSHRATSGRSAASTDKPLRPDWWPLQVASWALGAFPLVR